MAIQQRQVYRYRCQYNTKSNKQRISRTPGGRLVYLRMKKISKGHRCREPHCRAVLPGLPRLRPIEMSRVSRTQRKIARAYGGNLCGGCLRKRILRAFLTEEQKRVKEIQNEKSKLVAGN